MPHHTCTKPNSPSENRNVLFFIFQAKRFRDCKGKRNTALKKKSQKQFGMNIMFSLKSRRGRSSKTILNENVSSELGQPQSKPEKDTWCANLTTARNGLMKGMGGGGQESHFDFTHSESRLFPSWSENNPKWPNKELPGAERRLVLTLPPSPPPGPPNSKFIGRCFLSRNKIFMAKCLKGVLNHFPLLTLLLQTSPTKPYTKKTLAGEI